MGLLDWAAAVKCTGDATVLPGAGEQTVIPMVLAAQPEDVGGGVLVLPNMSAISAAAAAAPG